jgi:hypothetical protein
LHTTARAPSRGKAAAANPNNDIIGPYMAHRRCPRWLGRCCNKFWKWTFLLRARLQPHSLRPLVATPQCVCGSGGTKIGPGKGDGATKKHNIYFTGFDCLNLFWTNMAACWQFAVREKGTAQLLTVECSVHWFCGKTRVSNDINQCLVSWMVCFFSQPF